MKPVTAITLMIALVVLFVGGIVFQRCSFERQLAQQQATVTKADTQLVETTQQLATEHKEQARAQAKATVHAARRQVAEEVQRAEGDSDLYDYLLDATAGAHPSK